MMINKNIDKIICFSLFFLFCFIHFIPYETYRNQILENPNVEFCGYSIPHPSEEYFQLQIQTRNGLNVYDALLNGFEELSKLCDKTKKLFIEAVDKFKIDNNMS